MDVWVSFADLLHHVNHVNHVDHVVIWYSGSCRLDAALKGQIFLPLCGTAHLDPGDWMTFPWA